MSLNVKIKDENMKNSVRKNDRIRKAKIRRILFLCFVAVLISVVAFCTYILIKYFVPSTSQNGRQLTVNNNEITIPDYVDIQMIPKGLARTGIPLKEVKNIVVHYVGNPSTTAQNNRDYFAKVTTKVCSHFIIGLDGEVIQCVPLGERSAASNHRNKDTISIEVCHPDSSGKFNRETYASLLKLIVFYVIALNLMRMI